MSQIEVAERTVTPAVVQTHLSHALTSVSNKGLLWAPRPNTRQFKRSLKLETSLTSREREQDSQTYGVGSVFKLTSVMQNARAPRTRSCERRHLIALKSNVCPLRPHGQCANWVRLPSSVPFQSAFGLACTVSLCSIVLFIRHLLSYSNHQHCIVLSS